MLIKRFLLIVPIIIVFFASGCMSTTGAKTESEQGAATTATEPPAEPVHMSLMGTDFEDIEVPAELEIMQEDSIILNTSNFSGGTLVYRGNVTIESVIRFFRVSMPKNGWEFVASTFAKKSTLLTFVKPSKNCMIFVQAPGDWQRSARVQIWIGNSAKKSAPPIDQSLKNTRPTAEPTIRVR